MYRFQLTGYAYGFGVPLDITWVGYTYVDGLTRLSTRSMSGIQDLTVDQYIGKDDMLYLRFGPLNRYCNGFSLTYQGHYQHPEVGLNATEYKVTVTPDNTPL